MNIPFLRYVKYIDDGHYVYQCLNCGEKIDVGDAYFSPRFCWYCGVEYKGSMLRKQYDYISAPSTQQNFYQIQVGLLWEGDNEEDRIWNDDWRGSESPYKAIQYLKDIKKEYKHTSRCFENYKFQIIKKIHTKYHGYTRIDHCKYYNKTGEYFRINNKLI